MSETSVKKELLTPLDNVQLELFQELALTNLHNPERKVLGQLMKSAGYHAKKPPRGENGFKWAARDATNVVHDSLPFVGELYGVHDEDERIQILAHDLVGWSEIYNMTWDTIPSHPDHRPSNFEYLRDYALRYIEPQPELADPHTPRGFGHISHIHMNSMQKLRLRIEQGMPREMQLLCVAATLPGISATESNHLVWDSFRTNIICEELGVTPAELRCVYEIAAKTLPDKAPDLVVGLFSNGSLLGRYVDDALDDDLDESVLSDAEAVSGATRLAFASLIIKNNQDAFIPWGNLIRFLGYERIEEVISAEERTNLVHEAMLANLANPHLVPIEFMDELAVYIDEDRLSKEAGTLLLDLLKNPEKKRMYEREPSDFAAQLEEDKGINLQSEVLRYSENPYKKLIAATIRYGRKDSKDAYIAQLMLEESSAYDPVLRAMLNKYSILSKDDCLRMIGQGFCADDDPAWYEERAKRTTSYKKQIADLERRIVERALGRY